MRNQKGFTLFEAILYVSLIGFILVTLSSFVMQLMNARVKIQAQSEIMHSSRLFEERLSDAVRHAKSIQVGSSVFGTDPGVLSLEMIDPLKNPTVFRLNQDNGTLEVSEQGGAFVSLTTAKISVTNLVFTNLTTVKDKGVVRAEWDLSTLNPSNTPFYSATKSFQSSFRIPPLP